MGSTTAPSIRKNFIYHLLYEILKIVTPFITTPYVSRVLGADGVGIYSYTKSIIAYFTLFAALGTVSYGTREIAQNRKDRLQYSILFWEIELLTVLTSTISLFAWIGVIIFSGEYRWYYIALIPELLATMVDISWLYTGLEQIKYTVIRNSITKIAGIVLLFAFVKTKQDLLLYVILNSIVLLVGNLSMWTYLPKFISRVNYSDLRVFRHFKQTLVYFIPTIAVTLYTVMDKTLIGLITGSTFENGYYEQATKAVNIIKTLVFTSVNTVMSARISFLYAEEKFDEIKNRINKSMDFILFMGIACTFGLCGISKSFVPLFFGPGYDPVILLLYLMSPLICIIGISNCLGNQYYTPSGRRAQSSKYIIAGALCNLFLNLIFIRYIGAYGATIASVIAESLIAFLYVLNANGIITFYDIFIISKKKLLAGSLMLGMLVLIEAQMTMLNTAVRLAAETVIGAGVYFITLIVIRDNMMLTLLAEGKGIISRVSRRLR